MFVFLVNEHLIANFASFMLLGFNGVRDAVDNFTLANILRQWVVVFFGNWIGGGIFIGLAYSWLNKIRHLTLIRRPHASKRLIKRNYPGYAALFYFA